MAEKKAAKKAGEDATLEKIAALPAPFRAMGERIHAMIRRTEPGLEPTVWYGMPAYARDGKVICFFRADKYMTFGLTDNANHVLEEGATDLLRNASWFFTSLDDATEARLAAIVSKAAKGAEA
jgi:hypothetical protein